MDNYKCAFHPDASVQDLDNSQQRACSQCGEDLGTLSPENREELGLDSQQVWQDIPKPSDDGELWRAVLKPGTETRGGSRQQSHRQCMNLMKDICQKVKNPGLRKDAIKIVDSYLKYLEENEPGKAFITLNMAASAVYLAAMKTENVELQLEVIKICKQHKTSLSLGVQFEIIRALGLNFKYLKSEDIVPVFCRKLNLSSEVEKTATHIACAVKKLRRDIGKPSLLATIGIYIACQAHESDQYRTSEEVAKALDVPKQSFFGIAQDLVACTRDIFPPTFAARCTRLEYLERESIFSFYL